MRNATGEAPAGRAAASRVAGLAVAVFALAFCGLYLGSPSKWWHEDDPLQFARAAEIGNPADIFVEPGVLRHWGTGASLVPMHVLSYWVDMRLFGATPRAARLHQLAATVLVAVLIFVVLRRFGMDPPVAAAAACLWLCLPSTVAVHDYLGTRQYLEGLGWSLLACAGLQRVCADGGSRRARASAAALTLASAAAAMLCKETYAAAVPAFLFLYALGRRRYAWGAVAVALAAGYALYRSAALGDASYPAPAMGAAEYVRYLRTLPVTFAVAPTGWVLVVAFVVLAAAVAARRDGRGPVVLVLGVLAAGLAATYPTAPAVLLTYETPGTWYRAVFLFQTTVLLGGAYLLGRFTGRATRVAALLVFLAVVLPGTAKTRRHWLERLAESEAEGRFYLAHPERLVYSEEPAFWFLPGLDALYNVRPPHSIGKYDPSTTRAREAVDRYATIWRRRGAAWTEDDALYASIRSRAAGRPDASAAPGESPDRSP